MAAPGDSSTQYTAGSRAHGAPRRDEAAHAADGVLGVTVAAGAHDGSVSGTAMLLHEKKKQKLLEKAKSRPSAEVLGCAPVGTADIGSQPRLEAFVCEGRTSDEAIALHAVAMRDWMAKNISKKGMQKDTEVRAGVEFALRKSDSTTRRDSESVKTS